MRGPLFALSLFLSLSVPAGAAFDSDGDGDTGVGSSDFSFRNFRGANIQHGAYWLPNKKDADTLLWHAATMNLTTVRIPIPLQLVVQKTQFTERTLVQNVVDVMDAAYRHGLKVILVLDGYTAYDRKCGYKEGFVSIKPVAEKVVRAVRGHPALFAWDLLNEPLSGSACDHSADPSIIEAVHAMHHLVKSIDPETPTTVGEAFPELQKTWNDVVTFASPHIYFPDVKTPVTDQQLADMQAGLNKFIERLRKEVWPRPLVIGEFGFDTLGKQVNEEEQALAFQKYYEVLHDRDTGSLFWQLAINDYTVLNRDGSWKPAAYVIQSQGALP